LTHGAGLAVHHKPVMACRVTPDALGQQADGRMEVQECGTRTRDVLAGSDGLSEAGVTHVAMARTGAYGQPVDTLLEGPCPVGLGNAAPVKHVPGRKTDRAEARGWPNCGGRACGRRAGSPRRSREGNRGQGVLARAPSKLASVASAILGGSGRAILAALLEGRAAPVTRAAWATGRLRRQRPVLEQALPGWVRAHPRRVVAMPLAHLDGLAEPLDALRAGSARRLPELRAIPPTPRRRPPGAPPDRGAGGHGAGRHAWRQSTGWSAVGRRVADGEGALWYRRPPGRLERGRAGA
jgi:transposase